MTLHAIPEEPTLAEQLLIIAVADQQRSDADAVSKRMREHATARFVHDYLHGEDHNKSKVLMIDGVKVGTATLSDNKDKAVVTDENALIAWLEENNPEAVEYTTTIKPGVLKVMLEKGVTLGTDEGDPVTHPKTGETIPGIATRKGGVPTKFSITGRNVDVLRDAAATFDLSRVAPSMTAQPLEAFETIAGELTVPEPVDPAPAAPAGKAKANPDEVKEVLDATFGSEWAVSPARGVDLGALLTAARESAAGEEAEEIEPGVTRAEANVAAWHACVVQGGFSTPELEAKRLSADRARAEADVPLGVPAEDVLA